MKCFLCQENKFKVVYKLKNKNIFHCNNDGLIVGKATSDNKINTYSEEYFSNAPNLFNQSYFLKKLKTVRLLTSNFLPKTLDIGCGWGDFEEVLEKEMIPYLGIDINKQAIEICKKKGLNCKLSTVQQLTINKQQLFHVITLFQVIEHNKNPLPLLKSVKKLLKKGGVLLLTTPNNNSPLRILSGPRWSVYNEDSHYVFYNKKTLHETLELAGFKNIIVKIDRMRFFSLNYIFNRLKQIYFPNFEFRISNFEFFLPIPTDPLGDLVATAFID